MNFIFIALQLLHRSSLQKADIIKTHGDNKKILRITKYRDFIDWKLGIKKTIEWYLDFYENKKKNENSLSV